MRANARIFTALDVLFTKNAKKIIKKLGKNLVEPNKSITFAIAIQK